MEKKSIFAPTPIVAVIFFVLFTLNFPPQINAAEKPKMGGTLLYTVAQGPPTYDGHREHSFVLPQTVAPHYSTLFRFDPDTYPKFKGDVAKSYKVSEDGLIYTIEIKKGVKFHDGQPLTAQDVKATYDHIIFPPKGAVSARQATYDVVKSVEAPDDETVVFKLKRPSPSFLPSLASPWNFIYSAKKLNKDSQWYEKNICGTGPFVFVEHVPGKYWIGKRFKDYHLKGRPYLDGFKILFINKSKDQVDAIKQGKVFIEFRGFSPQERDEIVKALGKNAVVQEGPWMCYLSIAINTKKKYLDDPRVRRALSLAIDRWSASEPMSKVSIARYVGGLFTPGSPFAASDKELTQIAGFGKDYDKSLKEARRLLKEAGVPKGYKLTLSSRKMSNPYEPLGKYLADCWKKIDLDVELLWLDKAPFFKARNNLGFDMIWDGQCGYMDEPNLALPKFLSREKSARNFGGYNDPDLDEIYQKQARETDPEKRLMLLREFEKRLLDDQAWTWPTLWWFRINAYNKKVHGWKQLPAHYLNQDLRDVWLAD